MTTWPKTPLEQRLKQMLYEAGHSEQADFIGPMPEQQQSDVLVSDMQCEAMDDMGDI
jgi:hypothetical protein